MTENQIYLVIWLTFALGALALFQWRACYPLTYAWAVLIAFASAYWMVWGPR